MRLKNKVPVDTFWNTFFKDQEIGDDLRYFNLKSGERDWCHNEINTSIGKMFIDLDLFPEECEFAKMSLNKYKNENNFSPWITLFLSHSNDSIKIEKVTTHDNSEKDTKIENMQDLIDLIEVNTK